MKLICKITGTDVLMYILALLVVLTLLLGGAWFLVRAVPKIPAWRAVIASVMGVVGVVGGGLMLWALYKSVTMSFGCAYVDLKPQQAIVKYRSGREQAFALPDALDGISIVDAGHVVLRLRQDGRSFGFSNRDFSGDQQMIDAAINHVFPMQIRDDKGEVLRDVLILTPPPRQGWSAFLYRPSTWALLVTLLCLGWTGHLIIERAEAKANLKWPSVTGRITNSKRAQEDRDSFYAVVRYTYEVEGSSYESDQLAGDLEARWDVDRMLEKYPPAKEVPVYYDPEDPTNSVLERGPGKQSLLRIKGMAVITAICAACLVIVKLEYPRHCETIDGLSH
ncbi:MAG: DUF3592 domain-containing protein [Verrucomicrobiae bacterium]|nr:DUF3592 domain-containing protein [Verrucomicrobiae bacterium]